MPLFVDLSVPALVCFLVGLGLLIFEMFHPGFGIAGVSGIILLVVAVVLQANNFLEGLILFLAVGVLVTILAIIFYRSATRGAIAKSDVILKSEIGSSSSLSYILKIGDTGMTLTPLRPAGSADFSGTRADVVTRGEYIDADQRIEVLQIEGNRVVVRACEIANSTN